MSKLPSKNNISISAGEVFFRRDGAARAESLGHSKKFGWTPSIETLPLEVSTSGKKQKVGEAEIGVEAAVSLTLQELRPDVLAMAVAGKELSYIQQAATGVVVNAAGAKPGELIDLGRLDVTAVSVEIDGVPAEEGIDYTVLDAAGHVIVRSEGDYEVTFSAPAITTGRSAIEILNGTGLRGIFTVIGKNEQGKRYMLKNFRAVLRPTAEVPLHSDGSAFIEVELEGSAEYNEALPRAPWGELIELA